ncbi:transposase [Ochrobactrum sp. MR28]|nr:transposase [Ochrobactrum sp. MR28]MBX8817991.1 transposase [Ochrobactrum sp. MR31]
MKEWFSIAELAAANLPDLPPAEKSLDNLARTKWRGSVELTRQVAGKTKRIWKYHISLLPEAARLRLEMIQLEPEDESPEAKARREIEKQLWARFNALSKEQKKVCEDRLNVLMVVEKNKRYLSADAAVCAAADECQVSRASVYNWMAMVDGYDRDIWLAVLMPSSAPGADKAECHASAWEFLKSDFLRPEKPAFSACYRRMVTVAKKQKWAPIPSERALRRRLNDQVPKAVQVLARDGKEKAKQLFPAQRRTRSHLHAMQAVNMDGHKLDVFVAVPGIDKPVRMILLGIQDLYSGKLVAWRLTETECKEAVRLVIGDMVELWGIPEQITLDNGRAFASKWITGGTATRYRFKVRDEDPEGLLTTLGVYTNWAEPYAGQSKPIERTWRDLAENISKHPFCSGAYTGNKPDAKPENYNERAIPLEEFRTHVAAQIAEHNAQTGRRAANCKGRSFDETFDESLNAPATIIKVASPAQRSLWLLASEAIRARKGSGEIHYHGNRYWNTALNQYAGKKVTIRFDPDRLHDPVMVYDLDNRLICKADCIENTGFHDADAARHTARAKSDFRKAKKAELKAHATLSARELGDIYYAGDKAGVSKPTPRSAPKVRRIAIGNLAVRQEETIIDDRTFENSFSKALGKIAETSSIIQFPQGAAGGNEPISSAYGSQKK